MAAHPCSDSTCDKCGNFGKSAYHMGWISVPACCPHTRDPIVLQGLTQISWCSFLVYHLKKEDEASVSSEHQPWSLPL